MKLSFWRQASDGPSSQPASPLLTSQVSPTTAPDLELLRSKIVNLNALPMLPEVAIKALVQARDPDAPLRSLAAVIERDVGLTAGMLRLVNSPYYRTGRAIDGLEQAVVRLGIRECQNLIITVSMRSLYRTIPASKKQRCESLWHHSYLTGCLCRELNRKLHLGFQGQEFASGICHDVGRLLIAVGAPAYFELADPMDFRETPAVLERETEILGLNHSQLGLWYSQLNELPDSLTACIGHHHLPDGAGVYRPLVDLVALADDMANHVQRREKIEEYDPQAYDGLAALTEEWGTEQVTQFQELAPEIMAAVIHDTEGVGGFH